MISAMIFFSVNYFPICVFMHPSLQLFGFVIASICTSFLIYVFADSPMQIYVVDSLDRERIGRAKAEFQVACLERKAEDREHREMGTSRALFRFQDRR